jgi:hypothetical protein
MFLGRFDVNAELKNAARTGIVYPLRPNVLCAGEHGMQVRDAQMALIHALTDPDSLVLTLGQGIKLEIATLVP